MPAMPAPPARRRFVLPLVLAALAPASTSASNQDGILLSPEAALTGGAVLAGDDHDSGGWYNPAGLATLPRDIFQLGASAYGITSRHVSGGVETVLPWTNHATEVDSDSFYGVPSTVAYGHRFREGLAAGFGLYTPQRLTSGWRTSFASTGLAPGVAEPITYEQFYSGSSTLDDTWGAVALGWRAHPRVSVGIALQGLYRTQVEAVDLSMSYATPSSPPFDQGFFLDLSIRDDQTMLGARAVAGVQWDVSDRWRVAAVLRSPLVRVFAFGGSDRIVSYTEYQAGDVPLFGREVDVLEPESGLSIVEPGRISLGAAYRHGRTSLRAEVDWQPALERRLATQRSLWNVRAGGTLRLDENAELGLGFFTDRARGEASQGFVEIDLYGLAGGFEYRPAHVIRALGGTGRWDLLVTLAVRGAWGTGKAPGMRLDLDTPEFVIPIFPGQEDQPFLEAPARAFEGSVNLFTAIVF
jgi:hypothetical protein